MAEDSTEATGGEDSAPPKKRLSLIQISLCLQLFLVLAAGGIIVKATLFGHRPDLAEKTLRERAIASVHDDSAKLAIMDLEEFVVNVTAKKTLRAKIQVEVSNPEVVETLNARKPIVRARILDVLGAKAPKNNQDIQQKLQLKDLVREALNAELDEAEAKSKKPNEGVVREVYFVEFIII